MSLPSRRKLLIGATCLVLLAGAGAALAAGVGGSRSSSRQAYLEDLARRLNVSPAALTQAVKGADYDRIQAALAAGRISPSQAAALQQRVQRSTNPVPSTHLPLGAGLQGRNQAAARYLGVSAAMLRGELGAGRSLAEIAASTPGRSVAGLTAAVSAAERARLSHALSSGRITSRAEQERLDRLSGHVAAQIRRTTSGGPRRRSARPSGTHHGSGTRQPSGTSATPTG